MSGSWRPLTDVWVVAGVRLKSYFLLFFFQVLLALLDSVNDRCLVRDERAPPDEARNFYPRYRMWETGTQFTCFTSTKTNTDDLAGLMNKKKKRLSAQPHVGNRLFR
jgi:hypothetical protein